MAVRLDATGDYLRRTANLPTNGIGTISGWARVTTAPGSFCCLASFENAGLFTGAFLFMDSSGAITTYGSTPDAVSSVIATIGVGVPFFWAITNAGAGANNTIGYIRASSANTLSSQTLGGTTVTGINQVNVGNDSFGDNFNGRMFNVKTWDRVLTASELLVESYYNPPMFSTSLNFWWPLNASTDIADRSGNARPATAGGTLTTEDTFISLWRTSFKLFRSIASTGTTWTITPSGGVSFAGTADVIPGRIFLPTGGTSFSGTAPLIKGEVYAVSGGVSFGGTAPMTFSNGSVSYLITPTGGVSFSGTGAEVYGRVFQASGGVVLSGTSTIAHGIQYTPTGGVIFGGTASFIKQGSFVPSGGVVFSGSAPMSFNGGGGGATVSTRLPLTFAGN